MNFIYFYRSFSIFVTVISILFTEARLALQANGANFIFEHFDTFFSVVVHENKVELTIVQRAFTRIQKGNEYYFDWVKNFNLSGMMFVYCIDFCAIFRRN